MKKLTGMKRSVAVLTAAALVATAVPLHASAATTKAKDEVRRETRIEANAATDFSSQRRVRRNNNAAAAAMFGVVAGTIATIAINEQRRKRERNYWRHRNAYYGYGPGYYAPPQAYYAPQPRYYAPQPRYVAPSRHYPQGRYFGAPGTYYGGAVSAHPGVTGGNN